MRFISWNVNGIRACRNKGFDDFFRECRADVFCMQEVKATEEQSQLFPIDYHVYWHDAEKPGYSGTATMVKQKPLSVSRDMPGHTGEGRILTLELDEFYMVNIYSPNVKRELTRLDYRMEWQDALRSYLTELDRHKPIVLCGDLNVAHQEIDIKNFRSNRGCAGFTDQERGKMTELLAAGFLDTYRTLFPEARDAYTWWSYMGNARQKNVGWRIDYFLLSDRLRPRLQNAMIYPQILGSDHCPVGIDLE